MKNVVLIGFMGSGKSSVGQQLALELGMNYIDLDAKVEEVSKQSIPAIFEAEGEGGFRNKESEVLKEISHKGGAVISTGGGIVEREANQHILSMHGPVVFLDASFEEIDLRLQGDESRPLWKKPESERRQLFNKRWSLYKNWADVWIDTDHKSISDVVSEIKALINS